MLCLLSGRCCRNCWGATGIDGHARAVGFQPLYGALGPKRAADRGGSERLRRLRQWSVSLADSGRGLGLVRILYSDQFFQHVHRDLACSSYM